jgi:hypothetical protein
MTKDDIIRMAREAGFADGVAEIVGLEGFANYFADNKKAHEAALEQQQAEPVAWQYKTVEANIFVSEHRPVDVSVWNDIEWSKPLYTTPAQRPWQGLTEEDWAVIGDMPDTFDQGVAWAAARLKERNT